MCCAADCTGMSRELQNLNPVIHIRLLDFHGRLICWARPEGRSVDTTGRERLNARKSRLKQSSVKSNYGLVLCVRALGISKPVWREGEHFAAPIHYPFKPITRIPTRPKLNRNCPTKPVMGIRSRDPHVCGDLPHLPCPPAPKPPAQTFRPAAR
jgi:hypothetical protein